MKRRRVRSQMNKAPPRKIRFTIGLERDPRGRRPHSGADEAWHPTKDDVVEVTTAPSGCHVGKSKSMQLWRSPSLPRIRCWIGSCHGFAKTTQETGHP